MKHRIVHSAPLLSLTVCMMVGMAAEHHGQLPLPYLTLLAVGVLAAIIVRRRPVWQIVTIHVCFVLMGALLIQRADRQPSAIGGTAEVIVMSSPIDKPKTVAVDLLFPTTGERQRFYFWKDERSRQLQLGDALIVRDINDAFVGTDEWTPGGAAYQLMTRIQRLRLKALVWRQHLLGKFSRLTADDEQYAVLAAMTLGDKSAISKDTRETYSITGASHVLALSGLHLGIIYMLLTHLMPTRRRRWYMQLAVVLAVWAFAFLTGLSTSVVRSATMISIYALFSLRSGRLSSVNILAFAAFIMLLFDPTCLFDISFQLSFMAVFAILLIMPLTEHYVSNAFLQRHAVVRWLWGTVAVSCAAQIGVAPLVAYHFGRFSTYFLLTNLIVLPAVTVILYAALLFLVTSWTLVGQLMLTVVGWLNQSLDGIARLPMASIDGIYLSEVQVALCYLVIACLYLCLLILRPDEKDKININPQTI